MKQIEDINKYWNSRANGFSKAITYELDNSKNEWIDELTSEFGGQKCMKILDLGCGPGFFSILLASEGHEVTAVDYAEGMVEKARQNCAEKGISVKFSVMDAHNLQFEDSSFDVVVTRNLIWNLERPEKVYSEVLRTLNSGGKFVIFDGNHYLYQYDETYLDNYEKTRKKEKPHIHEKFNDDNVDFKIMEDIAKNLPLSKERRPQWDVGRLLELGFETVTAKCKDPRIVSKENGMTIYLPISFKIVATKGGSKNEC